MAASDFVYAKKTGNVPLATSVAPLEATVLVQGKSCV